ncbi:MAG: AfsR/SARP family transcriptional regulator, partial [Frankiaceae bacterium]
ASGHPLGREVIDAIGPPARSQLLALVTGPSGAAGRPSALAKSAHALLERLPRPVPHQLALGMLGRMTLRRDGVPVENGEWRRERVRQLLAYLVLHPVTTRSAAAAALWPDLEDIAANRNLRVTLTYLGQLLDPQHIGTDSCYFLATDGVLLRLAVTDIGLDVAGFEEALARARAADVAGAFTEAADCLQAAVRMYRGDLLAEFPDVEWAEAERGRLRALFVQAAVRAGEILLAKGDPAGAVALAGRALRAEPYAEAAYRLVIAAHLWSGDRAAALRAHRRCSRMLDELGIAPEPETRILERRLFGRPTASAPRQSPVSVPLSVR